MSFSINVNFDSEGLGQVLAAGQHITLLKKVNCWQHPGQQLVWISFPPLASNTITWSTPCAVYATETPIRPGATMTVLCDTGTVQPGQTFTFQNGAFSAGSPQDPPGGTAYDVSNGHGTTFGFGLSQVAEVNGVQVTAPLVVLSIPSGQGGVFQPLDQITLFLGTPIANGSVMSGPPPFDGVGTTLGPKMPSVTFVYDDAHSCFTQQSP